MWTRLVKSGRLMVDLWCQGPWTRDQDQGPGTRDQDHGPGTRTRTRDQGQDQGPGTKDQGPGTRDQGPRTKDQGPGTRDQGPHGGTWHRSWGNRAQGSGGTVSPGQPNRFLFVTVRTPRQAWLGNKGFCLPWLTLWPGPRSRDPGLPGPISLRSHWPLPVESWKPYFITLGQLSL